MHDPSDLKGLWRRSLIAWPDGRRDISTRVQWLQGIHAFVDLRQPASLPDFAHVRSLADLSMEDCAKLAVQEGFAGRLSFDGRHFEWVRRIDFQPAGQFADAGSLEWHADVLVERGRDVDYVEHWHRASGTALEPVSAVTLRDDATGTNALLLRVGNEFMFARDRAVALPPQRTLAACIAAAPTPQTARAWIDCEISAGMVTAAGFLIIASTLPFRRGAVLGQSLREGSLWSVEPDTQGRAATRVWSIVEVEGNLDSLARARQLGSAR